MMDMKPSPAKPKMPKSDHSAPAAKGGGSPGPERKAAMGSAMNGMPSGGLKGAINELKTQHPFRHDDPQMHHQDKSHVRHEPLAGMKPASSKY